MVTGIWVSSPDLLDPPGAGGILFREGPPEGVPVRPVGWRGPLRPGRAWLVESLLLLPLRHRWGKWEGDEARLWLEMQARLPTGEEVRLLFWGQAALAAREGLGAGWQRLRPGEPLPWEPEGERRGVRRWTPPVFEAVPAEEPGQAALAFLLARAGPEAMDRLRRAFPGLPGTADPEALAAALRAQASGRPFWRMAPRAAALARAWARRPPGPPAKLRALTGFGSPDPKAFAAGLALWWLFHPARRPELLCERDESLSQKSPSRRRRDDR